MPYLLLLPKVLFGQVSNNDIEHRIELKLDSFPIHSSTKNASVQWECINKKLTNTCLVYHNDQWFYFTPRQSNTYYINVTNQECRNLKGVQVLVIEGNPCETDTYKLKRCTSFTDQNDTFIKFDSLVAGKDYLINIDGFLGDQCDFSIQFATKPLGFPNDQSNLDTLSLRGISNNNQVHLSWFATEEQLNKLSEFEVFRKQPNTRKATQLGSVEVRSNSLGIHNNYYDYTDSLVHKGKFTYQIIGIDKFSKERYLLDDILLEISSPKQELDNSKYVATMQLNFPSKGEVEILVFDDSSDKFLASTTLKDGRDTTIPLDFTTYVNAGYYYFTVKARHLKSKNVIIRRFSINALGMLVQNK